MWRYHTGGRQTTMTSLPTIAPEQQREITAAHDEIERLVGYMSVYRASMSERQREERYAWITSGYSSTTLRGVLALLATRIARLQRETVRQIEIPVPVAGSTDTLLADLERQRLAFAEHRTWLDHCYEAVEFVHLCLGFSARQGVGD